jgi:catechol 2,3-dioxygenase-like lactoylglutathione lyase family enzyme
MALQLTSTVVQIFCKDVRDAIAFYRLLGLDVPEPPDGPDPHIDVELPGGNRLSFDAEQTITGMHPEWEPPDAAGRGARAFGHQSRARWRRTTRRGASVTPPCSTPTATSPICSRRSAPDGRGFRAVPMLRPERRRPRSRCWRP